MNNIVRGILTAFLCVALVGFGLCGVSGTFGGLAGLFSPGPGNFSSTLLVFGLMGLAIAFGCGWLVVRLWRKRPPAGE